MSSKFIHVVACIKRCIIFSCLHSPHFVYPAICWWTFGWFHLLAIVNNAAVSVGVQISVWVPTFTSFGYMRRSGIAEPYVILCLPFWEIVISSFTEVAPFCTPTSKAQGFGLFHILPNTRYVLFFDNGDSNGCEVVFHRGFGLFFFNHVTVLPHKWINEFLHSNNIFKNWFLSRNYPLTVCK